MSASDTVTIVDYGIGNVRSVLNMLDRIGVEGALSGDGTRIANARRLILPGVGAFDAGMRTLSARGLVEPVRAAIASGAQVLGICLGAQLLLEGSEEGGQPGIGAIPGVARRFDADALALAVPHMGWNVVRARPGSRLFEGAGGEQRFYFTHSYYMALAREDDVAATTSYGIDFACAFERGRVMGVQFHPEKSHRFGMGVFERFVGAPC